MYFWQNFYVFEDGFIFLYMQVVLIVESGQEKSKVGKWGCDMICVIVFVIFLRVKGKDLREMIIYKVLLKLRGMFRNVEVFE